MVFIVEFIGYFFLAFPAAFTNQAPPKKNKPCPPNPKILAQNLLLRISLGLEEKHAQGSLTEATDHMVDVLRKALREEKNRVSERKAEECFGVFNRPVVP